MKQLINSLIDMSLSVISQIESSFKIFIVAYSLISEYLHSKIYVVELISILHNLFFLHNLHLNLRVITPLELMSLNVNRFLRENKSLIPNASSTTVTTDFCFFTIIL